MFDNANSYTYISIDKRLLSTMEVLTGDENGFRPDPITPDLKNPEMEYAYLSIWITIVMWLKMPIFM